MMNANWSTHKYAMQLRGRGRPRTAEDELRQNGYKDGKGRYQLADGLKHWHTRVVDYMIFHPEAKIKDLAEAFDVSPQWMGQLLKADSFKEYYCMRMEEHQSSVSVAIVSKMQGVAVKALDKMNDKLDAKDISFGQVKEAAELSLKSLGYTAQGGINVAVHNQGKGQTNVMVAVPSSAVEKARKRIEARMKENGDKIEHDKDNYVAVTSSLEKGIEDVEDAVILSPDDDEV